MEAQTQVLNSIKPIDWLLHHKRNPRRNSISRQITITAVAEHQKTNVFLYKTPGQKIIFPPDTIWRGEHVNLWERALCDWQAADGDRAGDA